MGASALMKGVSRDAAVLFSQLTKGIEAPVRPEHASVRSRLGLHRSRKVVFRLSALFALDAFVLSGALKIVYDLLLYRNFRRIKAPEEQG